MKVLLSCILFSILLFGRENPFEPTDTYLERKAQLLKTQEEAKKTLEEEKLQEEKLLALREKEESQKVVKKEIEKEVQTPKFKTLRYELLHFISSDLKENSLTLNVEKRYKFINQIINKEGKKFVFDFKGKLSFYTKREKFNHKYFESITIGTHKKENFFRIVVKVKGDISNFKESFNKDKNIMEIKKIN